MELWGGREDTTEVVRGRDWVGGTGNGVVWWEGGCGGGGDGAADYMGSGVPEAGYACGGRMAAGEKRRGGCGDSENYAYL